MFKVISGYIVSLRPTWAILRPCFKNPKRKEKRKKMRKYQNVFKAISKIFAN